MQHYLVEIEHLIQKYRNHINDLDKMLAPHLSEISCEARQFITEFMNAWNEAICEKGLLHSYSQSAVALQKMLDDFTTKHPCPQLHLYNDIKHFLYLVEKEKDNDWHKALAESDIISDVKVLDFCYTYWQDKAIDECEVT